LSSTPTIPVDVVNQALDEIGVDPIGSITEGTTASDAAARIYWLTLRMTLSAAPWNFARAEIPLTLLGSRGAPNTVPGPPTVVGNPPPLPWVFMYDWPVDCVHARYVPRNADPASSSNCGGWWSPAPFLVHSYPLPNVGNWDDTEGHDPDQTKVILTNVMTAHLIYTKLMQYPDAWDALFQKAFSLCLAAQLCMPCIKDRKEGMAVRKDTRMLAVEALNSARVRDGNEGWTVVDHTPDWIRIRTSGPFTPWWPGTGWSSMPWGEDAGGVY
jgi:hypothetical protein